jgi:hypothetical protein
MVSRWSDQLDRGAPGWGTPRNREVRSGPSHLSAAVRAVRRPVEGKSYTPYK